MLNLKNQNILILGLGESGLSMVRWCVFCGANVWVVDNREEPPHLKTLRDELPQVQFIQGAFEAGVLNAVPVKAVFKSPGLEPKVVQDLWQQAASLGLAVGTELSLFALAMNELKERCLYDPNVLAVTGTNGKTTVTSLTAALLKRAQMRVAVAGNIGPALLDTLRTHLSSTWVEELRAFDLTKLEQELSEQQRLEEHQKPLAQPQSSARGVELLALEDELVPKADEELTQASEKESTVESIEGAVKTAAEEAAEEVAVESAEESAEALGEQLSQAAGKQGEVHLSLAAASAQTMSEKENETESMAEVEVEVSLDESTDTAETPKPIVSFEQRRAEHLLALFPWLEQMPQAWVLELSSFQLSGVSEFEPTAASILNITQDHLDWHVDMQDYAQAKGAIFGEKTTRILNRDDPGVMNFVPKPKERVKTAWGSKSKTKAPLGPQWVEFGFSMPQRPGDFGVEQVNGMAWLVRALSDSGLRIKKNQEAPELEIQRLMPVDALRIFGRHNASNALAALALASTTQAKLAPMLYALREYTGEPHRIQPVQIIDGVEYIDDSKGTNVGATVAALEGLGHDRKLVLILGGDAKGQDFTPLIEPIRRFVRAVMVLGKDAQSIEEVISAAKVSLFQVQSLREAVLKASQVAKNADAVLLSPACSSLDMFKNYAHRAQVFVEAVAELSEMGTLEAGPLDQLGGVKGFTDLEVRP